MHKPRVLKAETSSCHSMQCRQLASHVCEGVADLDSTLRQQQAHVAAATQLCQLELLCSVEHDVLGGVHNLLIPAQIWSLHAAIRQKTNKRWPRFFGYGVLLPHPT